jgi:4-hydroxy-tetrahydrodipicolinate reductase
VLAQISENPEYVLAGVVSRTKPDSADAPEASDTDWFNSLDDFHADADLLIDFTLPGGTGTAAAWCEQNGVPMVSGTTGLTDEDFEALEKASLKVPVLWAPNLSHGVALLTSLVRQAANVLGLQANITISDIHHEHKIDAPSGTALALAEAVMEGRSQPLEHLLADDRLKNGDESEEGELAFLSVREGEVIGEHTVGFELPGEVVEVSHKALDRDVFAAGALKAGTWLVSQSPGYYTTSDWLHL